ncbi:Cytochrome C oxidase, cbb3-type, subunit III [Flavobacterium fluvii]|uniref:Cytochrome C oxidase, cbb3-type, subunit III n=1 Tax=Flavobacterium fluvii TaxID=468056 RepID=A0A1M5N6P6_9FLAO|nr:cytochrome c [Flavobacterium fluvii]SHG85218.1 Cytochrome C oxidase, cbb3-type, subunit III [Flavobacterium fluvii]
MKKILFGLAVLAALSFTQNTNAQAKPKGKEWKVPAADAAKKSTVKAGDASAIAAGKEIWARDCKSCHGVKGLGDGSKAAKIDISCGDFSSKEFQSLSDGAIFYKTKIGRKPMPSFKEKLSDAELWQVTAYMRTFKK